MAEKTAVRIALTKGRLEKDTVGLFEKMGFDVDKKKIEIGTIKSIGSYQAVLKLHPTVSIKIPVDVVAE